MGDDIGFQKKNCREILENYLTLHIKNHEEKKTSDNLKM
jgi:hypothetical protein